MTAARVPTLVRAALRGAAAGLVGVAAMTAGEKLEQAITRRPDSYVPARALLGALDQQPGKSDRPPVWNHLMHWGTGALLGGLRGVWAATGLRGPAMNVWHTAARLTFDQTVENATGAGAPPTTWPRSEQVVDVLHKAVYSSVTGMVADRWIRPTLQSARGRRSH